MPWNEVTVMEEKKRFIHAYQTFEGTFSSLCASFGITRKTGYKYLERHKLYGFSGLEELSRKPKTSPSRTRADIEQTIINIRNLHPAWAGEKIKIYLSNKGYKKLPSEKTIDRILKRNGLITFEESQKHKPWIRFEHENPNDLWQMDFKGHFPIKDGRCHPLTLLDDHSRFSLLIRACDNERENTVKNALIDTFRQFGLPQRMTMDNGSPWGCSGNQEHTTLTAWLIRLGIFVTHSRPKHPQTQGKLERFHRTLKVELLKRFFFTGLQEAQEGFDWWQKIYNEERPHQAIEFNVPVNRYRKSKLLYPDKLPSIEYENCCEIRMVQKNGKISFRGKEYKVGYAFNGQPVGLKEADSDGVYDVYYCRQRVVKIDLRFNT